MTLDPNQPCRCGHERKWHDACSRCYCPFFLLKGTSNAALVKQWNLEGARRKQSEGSR